MGPFMFDIFPVLFAILFVFVFGFVFYTIIRRMRTDRKNDRAPRLTVFAKVVAKRTDVFRRNGADMHHGHTQYYATFEVASGDRMELEIPDTEFGFLVEGDVGQLTFQGSRFLEFTRQ